MVESKLRIEQVEDVTVIHLSEAELMGKDANLQLRKELLEYLERMGSRKVVVSMQRVRRLTSETINSLLKARNKVAASDGEIRLANVSDEVRAVLALLKLDGGVFRVYESTEAALKDLTEE